MNAQELKDLRKRLGLTQHQMSEKLGCSTDLITSYETGRQAIPKGRAMLAALVGEQAQAD